MSGERNGTFAMKNTILEEKQQRKRNSVDAYADLPQTIANVCAHLFQVLSVRCG